jgi:predicted ATPase/class 3 adenylate cyclase
MCSARPSARVRCSRSSVRVCRHRRWRPSGRRLANFAYGHLPGAARCRNGRIGRIVPVVPHLPSGTLTFLFTDLEGSTRLWEERPAAMRDALAQHDELLRAAVESSDGFVFSTGGDGFAAAFERAGEAVAAAIAAQHGLASTEWPMGVELRVRIGLHTGEAHERDGDYFGPALNRAARLMAAAHGGQIVCSHATADVIRDLLAEGVGLVDLGEHRLRDLTRSERVFQITHPGLGREFPALRSVDTLPGNLPLQPNIFVGREAELRSIREALDTARIVTLTGVGGVGKTRLALQVAAEAQPRFRHGAWLCELAPLTSPDAVDPLVASVMGVEPAADGVWSSAIVETLASRQLLLVLDNCEHVLDAAATLADALVRSCPEVVLVATSREGLGVTGERIMPVGPLAFPGVGDAPEVARAADAFGLFVSRARDVRPLVADDEDTIAAIAQVCRRLDGIPLAIELAAARTQSLSVAEIALHLDDRFKLLTRGARTALGRHQTLRAAIDWSFDLLNDAEQRVLTRGSVFAGGFTLEAAAAVCDAETMSAIETLDHVDGLVRRSMLIAEDDGTTTRYRMLETIRQYGAERLEAMGKGAETSRAHLKWCTAFALEAGKQLRRPDDAAWVDRMLRELDNIRTALNFAISTSDLDAATTLLASAPAGALWANRLGASMAALASGVAPILGEPDHPVSAAVLSLLALDAALRFAGNEAVELAQRACAVARRHDDWLRTGPWLAWLLSSLIADRSDIVMIAAREALARAIADDDAFAIAEWHGELGIAHWFTGDLEEAQRLTEVGLALAEKIGADNLVMRNAFLRGVTLLVPGPDLAVAFPHLERAAQLGARVGGNVLFGGAAWAMLLATRGSDNLPAAAAELRDQCAMLATFKQGGGIRFWSTMAASLLIMAGELEIGSTLMGAAAPLKIAAGPLLTMLWEQTAQRARDGLEGDRFEELLAEGRGMPVDDVLTLVLRSLDDLAQSGG